MKFFLVFLTTLSLALSATCPSQCNGHGTCTKSGTCSCYEGYTFGDCSGKVCPYGKTYVEPSAHPSNTGGAGKEDKHTDLECSGKGNCDRSTGICQCYGGFEGNACQRTSCPNSCNGHGLCVPVKHLSLDVNGEYKNSYGYAQVNTGSTKGNYQNNRYDGDQSYACVCDGEYSGYDCSEKKCPTGYSATSDCESSSSTSTQTFSLTVTTSETGADNANSYKCLAYLEYTDMLGRKWYSDRFCTYCEKKTDASTSPSGPCDTGILGWNEALQRLPVGVIDPDTTAKCNDPIKCTTVEITFGSQQTGRQNPLKLISNADLKNDNYPGSETPSGYHGMSTTEIPASTGTPASVQIGSKHYTSYGTAGVTASVSGIKPTECGGNGSCDTETGLCNCFTGFYGIACTMTEDMM